MEVGFNKHSFTTVVFKYASYTTQSPPHTLLITSSIKHCFPLVGFSQLHPKGWRKKEGRRNGRTEEGMGRDRKGEERRRENRKKKGEINVNTSQHQILSKHVWNAASDELFRASHLLPWVSLRASQLLQEEISTDEYKVLAFQSHLFITYVLTATCAGCLIREF